MVTPGVGFLFPAPWPGSAPPLVDPHEETIIRSDGPVPHRTRQIDKRGAGEAFVSGRPDRRHQFTSFSRQFIL